MAKTPTVERFRLVIEREFEAQELGGAIANLTRLGFDNVRFELITDVLAFRTKTQHAIKAADFLSAWIAEHPTFSMREVSAHFKADGRTASAAYYALKMLTDQRVIKRLDDDGHYSRADVKHIEAPTKAAKSAKRTRQIFEVDHREFILRYMRSHGGRTSTTKLREYFTAHKRNPNSVSGALNKLVERKQLKLLGDGAYLLLAKGGMKPKPKPVKSNGNGLHVEIPTAPSEVTLNG